MILTTGVQCEYIYKPNEMSIIFFTPITFSRIFTTTEDVVKYIVSSKFLDDLKFVSGLGNDFCLSNYDNESILNFKINVTSEPEKSTYQSDTEEFVAR